VVFCEPDSSLVRTIVTEPRDSRKPSREPFFTIRVHTAKIRQHDQKE